MIYITGANGWLGLNLVKSIVSGASEKWGLPSDEIKALILPNTEKNKLKSISKKVNIVEGDISNEKAIKSFFEESNDSIVFHTAGIIHPKKVSDFFKVNRDRTKILMNCASKASIKKMVIISSNSPCGCNKNRDSLFNEKSPYNP